MGHDDAREGGEATAGHHPNARDARVKELNEMTIGRTDDPEIPLPAQAFEAAEGVWDWIADPIWASGQPHKQAGHMIAVDPPVSIIFLLHPRGRPHMREDKCDELRPGKLHGNRRRGLALCHMVHPDMAS
jgi:hypothetical protein